MFIKPKEISLAQVLLGIVLGGGFVSFLVWDSVRAPDYAKLRAYVHDHDCENVGAFVKNGKPWVRFYCHDDPHWNVEIPDEHLRSSPR